MNRSSHPARLVLLGAAVLLAAMPALAADGLAPAGRKADRSAAQSYFTDVALINQYGEEMRLYSDLLEGKVVVVNVFFTSCNGVCPIMAKSLAEIQQWLGDRLGSEVHLISISVDPENDTPPRVAEYAERFGAERGWYFLTGSPEKVAAALGKLGQAVEEPEAHSNILILGNEPTGLWKKALGLADVKDLISIVQSVIEDAG